MVLRRKLWRRPRSVWLVLVLSACTVPFLPQSIHRILACIALIAGFLLGPVLAVGFFALIANRIAACRYQYSMRSMMAFVLIVALALVWLPNAHPIDWLFGIAFDEETIYSPGYTAWRWCQVRHGMSQDAVLKLLGPPLTRVSGFGDVWSYTSYGPSETYHRRDIHFKNGAVAEKRAYLYVDRCT